MVTKIEGIYRNGRIELAELPNNIPEDTPAIVTFIFPDDLNDGEIDLETYGIDETQAQSLQANLASFASDWNSPEMNIYDHYDAAKSNS